MGLGTVHAYGALLKVLQLRVAWLWVAVGEKTGQGQLWVAVGEKAGEGQLQLGVLLLVVSDLEGADYHQSLGGQSLNPRTQRWALQLVLLQQPLLLAQGNLLKWLGTLGCERNGQSRHLGSMQCCHVLGRQLLQRHQWWNAQSGAFMFVCGTARISEKMVRSSPP